MQSALVGTIYEVRKVINQDLILSTGFFVNRDMAERHANKINEETDYFAYVEHPFTAISFDGGKSYQKINLELSQAKIRF